MSEQSIERIDEIPIIFHKVKQMGIQERIDRFWPTHGNWQGLSYGQLAVLFMMYVIHSMNHRLSGMEAWVTQHQHVLEQLTGWTLTPKDATDDRLGLLIEAFGTDLDRLIQYQIEQGASIVQAYALPTAVGRFDLTSFNVYHAVNESANDGVLAFGHSKDRRPDLLQFKQSLGTLDPCGVPLLTMTLKGNTADDPYYVPAWEQMAETLGNRDFIFVGDCKMGSLETRAKIAQAGGIYLCPLPMTGHVPDQLDEWIHQLPVEREDLYLEGKKEGELRKIGQGFEVEKVMTRQDELGEVQWKERWLVVHSDRHAKKQQAGFLKILEKAEKAVKSSLPKATESVADWETRLNKILEEQGVSEFLTVRVQETTRTKKHYLRPGRPTADTPYRWETECELSCRIDRQAAAIEAHQQRMGWRIYVTNADPSRMTLQQSVKYYRDEYTVERGFHRFKGGSLPVLPLFVRIDERIKGLLFLLFMCLQVLTLMDFVARRELEKTGEKLAGLVPGNPKMATARPTAERLLEAFKGLHLFVEKRGDVIVGYLVEKLSPLQEKILSLLHLPKEIYDLSFITARVKDDHDPAEDHIGFVVAT
jgi:transposase